jgi:hypothetical protein
MMVFRVGWKGADGGVKSSVGCALHDHLSLHPSLSHDLCKWQWVSRCGKAVHGKQGLLH